MLLTQKLKTDMALISVSLKYLIDHHLRFHSVLENISFCPHVFGHLVLAGRPLTHQDVQRSLPHM